jgi:hypothetical protein
VGLVTFDACKRHVIASDHSVDNGRRWRKRVMNRLLDRRLDKLVSKKDDAYVVFYSPL